MPAYPIMSLMAHLRGWLWDHSLLWRRPARRVWDVLQAIQRRLRRSTDEPPQATVRVTRSKATTPPPRLPHPAIVAIASDEEDGVARLERFLATQTETSVVVATDFSTPSGASPKGVAPRNTASEGANEGGSPKGVAPRESLLFLASGALDGLPTTHLEGLLLAAAAEDLPLVRGGWTLPGRTLPGGTSPGGTLPGETVPGGSLASPTEEAQRLGSSASMLIRPPFVGEPRRQAVVARDVRHVTDRLESMIDDCAVDAHASDDARSSDLLGARRAGPYHLGSEVGRAETIVHAIDQRLAALPVIDGPPTALFLMPYVAVGGAERQLLDVLDEWGGTYRCLIVTLEPHGGARGHMLDAFRDRTPHVYPLGDWLPREAHDGAIRHLLRRYKASALVGWNGTVLFYDQVGAWRRDFPHLRISNQVYNHEDGWISHYGPRIRHSVDTHFAVNRRIGTAMTDRHGVDASRVAVIHPAARVVALPDDAERQRRKLARRQALGLPADALVVGTFIRLHAQKRPLDILELARRFAGQDVHFLLVGGGPLDVEIDDAVTMSPIPNLTRFGLRHDVEDLYEALDLCLMTSAFEGLPVFLLDGLVREIPCVTTAVGDIPLLLEHGGGIAVDRPGDLDGLAAGIDALRDPKRRATEGARGRATVVSRFHMAGFAARYRAALFPDDCPGDSAHDHHNHEPTP